MSPSTLCRRCLLFLLVLLPLSILSVASADERVGRAEPGGALDLSGVAVPSPAVADLLAEADRLVVDGRLLEARDRLLPALGIPDLTAREQESLRQRIEAIHRTTLLSPPIVPGDPLTDRYLVEPRDTLEGITSRLGLQVDWRLLQRINRLGPTGRVRAFEPIKVVRGPFHARVSKSEHRLDLYAGVAEHPEHWLYVMSFPVGLGTAEATPTGTFYVERGGKVIDPFWTDARSGTWYAPGAEDNPLGDRWIGLEGLGESASLEGYGLHGTTDPASIGESRSRGCVRLRSEDIHLVFELLTEEASRVTIEN